MDVELAIWDQLGTFVDLFDGDRSQGVSLLTLSLRQVLKPAGVGVVVVIQLEPATVVIVVTVVVLLIGCFC